MIIDESIGTTYPFYSDYPTITEYGVYFFDSQSDSTSNNNVFIKMDNTPYNYCGGAPLNRDFYVQYTGEYVAAFRDVGMNRPWFRKEQESSRFSLKRCSGTESSPPLVVFKVDKILQEGLTS